MINLANERNHRMTLENHSSACFHKLLRGRRNGGCTELAVLFVNKDKRTLVGYGVTNYIVQVSCLAHCDSAAECSSHSPWPTPSRPRRMWSLTAHPPGRVRIGSTAPPPARSLHTTAIRVISTNKWMILLDNALKKDH